MATLQPTTVAGGPSPWMNAAVAHFEGFKRFVSDWRRRSAFRQEIRALDSAGNLDMILDDLGLSRWEIEKLVRGYPEADRLLPNMADRRGVDIAALDPSMRFELRHTCALCDAHSTCRHFLAAGAQGEAAFCPNAARFDALRAPVSPG